jgi:hypothetical protein
MDIINRNEEDTEKKSYTLLYNEKKFNLSKDKIKLKYKGAEQNSVSVLAEISDPDDSMLLYNNNNVNNIELYLAGIWNTKYEKYKFMLNKSKFKSLSQRSIKYMKSNSERSIKYMKSNSERSIKYMKSNSERSIKNMKSNSERSIKYIKEESTNIINNTTNIIKKIIKEKNNNIYDQISELYTTQIIKIKN